MTTKTLNRVARPTLACAEIKADMFVKSIRTRATTIEALHFFLGFLTSSGLKPFLTQKNWFEGKNKTATTAGG